MRKLFLILLMIPLTVCSQEGYKPLLREGRAWKHVFSSVARSYERVLTVGGDTLIGGLRWKKVYNGDQYEKAMLEDGKKVYELLRGAAAGSERLLFDFGLQQGDIVCFPGVGNEERSLEVTGEDSVYSEGIGYRRLLLRQRVKVNEETFITDEGSYWIEGVGSECGIERECGWTHVVGYTCSLESCYDDDVCIFNVSTYGVIPSGVAQDNTLSMFVDGRNWRYEHLEPDGNGRPIDGAGEGYITYQYVLKVDGDTIFDGRPCKKINWDGPKDIYWEVSEVTTPYAYGYEEDGKVMLYALYTLYAFYPAFPEKQWVTLYDFNVQKDGLCNMAAFWRKGMIVREDGMVDKDGTVRRYIGLGYDNSSTSIVYAVEGIGSSFGLFEFINLITDGSNSRFIGCYDGETCLYSADDFNSLSTDIRSIQAAKRSQPSGIFNLQGQQLSKTPQHGLYIQNGKKICR